MFEGGDLYAKRDGSGPIGMGPMTGRGAGFCAGFPSHRYMNGGVVSVEVALEEVSVELWYGLWQRLGLQKEV